MDQTMLTERLIEFRQRQATHHVELQHRSENRFLLDRTTVPTDSTCDQVEYVQQEVRTVALPAARYGACRSPAPQIRPARYSLALHPCLIALRSEYSSHSAPESPAVIPAAATRESHWATTSSRRLL